MALYQFIIIFLFLWKFCLCYEIPNVKLNILNNGFSLSIPDEPGLKKAVYAIKINNDCPTIMDVISESQNDWWTTTQETIDLNTKDNLNISILVNYLGNPYISQQYLVVGENNFGTKVSSPSTKQPNNCGNTVIDIKCKESQTVVSGISKICQGQLIFEENFVNTQLDLIKWSHDIRHRLIGTTNEEFVLFDNRIENIFIRDGYLNIKPTFTQENMNDGKVDFGSRCTPVLNRNKECQLITQPPYTYVPPVNSSQINTSKNFRFKYGRIEVKAKLPRGDWILPYIMLQHFDISEEKQIRIAFVRGNEELLTSENIDMSGKVLYAGIVSNAEKHTIHFHQKSLPEHYGNDFHIYALNWKNNEIILEVDGVIYGTITEHLEEFNELFFITLGVSVGGHYEFPNNLQKPWSNVSPKALRDFWYNIKNGKIAWNGNETMQIDYVRVYAV